MHKRGYIKEQLEQMNIARELLINRYMLSVILSNLFAMDKKIAYFLDQDIKQRRQEIKQEKKEEKESNKVKEKRKEINKEKKKAFTETIQFERFSITSEQYQALVNEYGVEVTTDACVFLDGYLKETGLQVKDYYRKLKQWAIHLVMRDRLSSIRRDIQKITQDIDYKTIEDKDTARKYIISVPDHMRNIDPAVKYLVEKFDIKGE